MPKPSIGSALTSSLRAEQKAVDQRFSDLSRRLARADHVLHETREEIVEPREQVLVARDGTRQPDIILRNPGAEEGDDASSRTVVRANFSMPVADHDLIFQLRERCSRSGVILSQSEILRAGLHALQNLPLGQLLTVAKSIEHLKPGPMKKPRRVR